MSAGIFSTPNGLLLAFQLDRVLQGKIIRITSYSDTCKGAEGEGN
jgi:hypothetical protein